MHNAADLMYLIFVTNSIVLKYNVMCKILGTLKMAVSNSISNDASGAGNVARNPLHESWHDPAWIPALSTHNVMDYFSERTNPFYDRTCNNEVLKMQRVGMQGAGPIDQHLPSMVGVEYILLCAQEPILYVIRKQQRHSPSQVTTIADYYIVAGVVYQVYIG